MSKTRRPNNHRSYLPVAARRRPAHYDPDRRAELEEEAIKEDYEEELQEDEEIDEYILKKIKW